jgi:CBS-domain-containing membrane protein
MLPKEALLAAPGIRVPAGAPESRHNDFAKAAGITAASIMTGTPITITPDEPVTSAARLMYSCKVKSLPVVTEHGHLVGIISRADVLSVYCRSGAEIGREITQDVIMTEFGGDPSSFTVTVKDGIVTLGGRPQTAQQGRNILAEVWHVEGVVSVRDRLTYPEERSSSHV